MVGYINRAGIKDYYHNYFALLGIAAGRITEPLILTLVFTLAFVFYLQAIRNCPKEASPLAVLAWTGTFTACLLLMFPFACKDVFYYLAIGRLQSYYQVNPYFVTAHQIAGWSADPFLSNTGWGFLLNVYGPVWTKVSHWLVVAAANHLWQAVAVFKLWAALLHLLNTLLVGKTARRLGLPTAQSMLIYGWNPLLLFELPGHAHNDALLLTFVLLAFYALSCGWASWHLPCLTMAALVKYTPVLLMPLGFLWLLMKRQYQALAAGCLLSTLLTAAAWTPYWQGFATLKGLFRQMNFYSLKSLHYISVQALQAWFSQLPKTFIFTATANFLLLFFLLLYVCHLVKFVARERQSGLDRLVVASSLAFLGYLLLATKWFQPWYMAWLIPLAALIRWPLPPVCLLLLLSYTAELSRIPLLLTQHNGISIQLAAFLIIWLPLLCYCLFPVNRIKSC
ncbi:hypothetical protein JCM39194_07260 [Desulfotomaculum varum]